MTLQVLLWCTWRASVWCLTGNMQIGSSSNMSGQSGGSVHMRSLACRLTGELVGADIASHSRVSVDCTRSRCQGPVDWSQVRKGLALVGLQYGPQFSGAWNVRVKAGETAQGCMKSIPNALPSDHNETGMMVHPAALDGCLQLGAVMHVGSDSTEESSEGAYVPAGFGALCTTEDTRPACVCLGRVWVVSPSASGSVVTNHVLQMKGGLPVAVLSRVGGKADGSTSCCKGPECYGEEGPPVRGLLAMRLCCFAISCFVAGRRSVSLHSDVGAGRQCDGHCIAS